MKPANFIDKYSKKPICGKCANDPGSLSSDPTEKWSGLESYSGDVPCHICSGMIDLTPAMTTEEIEAAERNERIFSSAGQMVDMEQVKKICREEFARKGGKTRSAKKTAAARENGKKGGRPRKPKTD